jgi:hypothetical protein
MKMCGGSLRVRSAPLGDRGYGTRVCFQKIPIEVTTMRSIWRWSLVLVGSTVMLGQGLPIKMGLWESTSVIDDGDGSPDTAKVKICITPGDWEKMLKGGSQLPQGCAQNLVKTARGYTIDASCNNPNSAMKMHGTSTIVDAEHMQAEMQTTMTVAGKTTHIVMHSTGRFVSAACGTVEPGAPDIE